MENSRSLLCPYYYSGRAQQRRTPTNGMSLISINLCVCQVVSAVVVLYAVMAWLTYFASERGTTDTTSNRADFARVPTS